jgi:DNA-binding protein HU-beta
MNKKELMAEVAQKTGMTKKDSEKVVTATFEVIEEALSKNDKVQLVGFGTFSVKDRAERTGFNPQTKEKMIIPATKTPHFKSGKRLKDCCKEIR